MTNFWTDNKRKNAEGEAVIVENKFHERLSDVRNQKQVTNHPDIELLKEEQRRQRQKHLATMYGVPALQGVPAAAMQAAASIAATSGTHGTDFDQTIHPGQLQSNRSAILAFPEFVRALERETKRSVKFERPYTLAIVGFHHLPVIMEQYGQPAYEAAMQRISDVLTQVVDIDIDTVGSYTHDRFIMILPELPGPHATMTAETIRGYFD